MIFVSLLLLFCALLLLVCGIYLSVEGRFFQIFKFKDILSVTFGKLFKTRDFEGFKAMSVALGSTIGIGNIVGVTAAICIGGPGAVFWMLVTGILGMMTKFTEIYICAEEAKRNGQNVGGPMYALRSKCKGVLKKSGTVFAVSTLAASFLSGNVSQASSIFEFSRLGFGLKPGIVILIILPLLLTVVSGKDKLYKNFSAVFVPLMALFYVLAVVLIILKNTANLPLALSLVFCDAFGIAEIAGGISGSILALTVKEGIMKGLFTNEAGMGSSPIAHCSAKELDPYTQGCWGIVEVFVDTVLVCMLTALAVLSSPIYLSDAISDPFLLITKVFQDSFGDFGIKALSLSAICFAFASVVGWSFYGIKALEFLTDKKHFKLLYIFVFVSFVPVSAYFNGDFVWVLTDLSNSVMLIPNVILLLFFGNEATEALRKGSEKCDLQSMPKKMRCSAFRGFQ